MEVLKYSHSKIKHNKLTGLLLFFPPANTENNLETSDVSKTVNFNMAASLLEVSKSVTWAENMIYTSPFFSIKRWSLFPAGQQVFTGDQFDPSFLQDQQRECDQTPQLRTGLRLQRRLCQGNEADLVTVNQNVFPYWTQPQDKRTWSL